MEYYGSFGGSATIFNCTFEFNTVTTSSNVAVGGGGLIIFDAREQVVIQECNFNNNTVINKNGLGYALGGGLLLAHSDSRVVSCDFRDNYSTSRESPSAGGATHVQFDNPQFINCLATENSAEFGGGFDILTGSVMFSYCTISGNTATKLGGALHAKNDTEAMLINCIMWDNGPDPIVDEENAVTIVNYSDIQGGWKGAGGNNIDADPMFVDPGSGDYRLLAGSPCIDAADSSAVPVDITTDLDGNPRFIEDPNTKDTGQGICPIVDMGSYEFQEGTPDCCQGDLDGNGSVGTSDLLELFAQWGTAGSADFDDDGNVGTSDLLILFANWGPCG